METRTKIEKHGRSAIWNYFVKKDDINSECLKCNKMIANKGNTTNLRNHLKAKPLYPYTPIPLYPYILAELEKLKTAEFIRDSEVDDEDSPSPLSIDDTPCTSSTLSTVSEREISIQKWNSHSKQTNIRDFTLSNRDQQRIDAALAYFVTTDMMPYNIVEKDGFQLFVRALNPAYKLPGRKSLTDSKIPKLFNETKTKIQQTLEGIKFISFTTDCWTSAAKSPFISLTGHFVNDEFELKSACLGCNELSDDHDHINIADALNVMMTEWSLDGDQVAITTDYGSNVLKAVQVMGKHHICCFGHAVNIAINDSFKIDELDAILQKIKKIQSIFAHSWKAQRELHKIQELLHMERRNIPSFSKTRWWSLLRLMRTIIEQELSLIQFLQSYCNGKYQSFILDHHEIMALKFVSSFLEPLEEVSSQLASENHVTASAILTIVDHLLHALEIDQEETCIEPDRKSLAIQTKVRKIVTDKLKDRYTRNPDTLTTLQVCTFLDPRFKNMYFDNKKDDLEVIKHKIISECNDLCMIESDQKPQNSKKVKRSGLSSFLNKSVSIRNLSRDERILNEVSSYLQLPDMDPDDDPLKYWKTNSNTFQHLAQLAKKYLCIQGTSIPSERIFSKGGLIVSDFRTCLTGDHTSQLIFTAMNKSFLPRPRV